MRLTEMRRLILLLMRLDICLFLPNVRNIKGSRTIFMSSFNQANMPLSSLSTCTREDSYFKSLPFSRPFHFTYTGQVFEILLLCCLELSN